MKLKLLFEVTSCQNCPRLDSTSGDMSVCLEAFDPPADEWATKVRLGQRAADENWDAITPSCPLATTEEIQRVESVR